MNATTANPLPTALDPTRGVRCGRREQNPNRPRRAGRLDDAIAIETIWPRLAEEVARSCDYRRLHRVEAALHGRHALDSTRSDREVARVAEAALAEHQRRVRAASYVPRAASLFRIH